MKTLLLSNWALPAAPALAEAARRRGWKTVSAAQMSPGGRGGGRIILYGSTLDAMQIAARHGLALLEPPLDLLARLEPGLRLRAVEYGRWSGLGRLGRALFIKPADPLDKVFDAGIYCGREQIRTPKPIPPHTPVLLAEPVEWLAEYRCFVLEGRVVTWSPYLNFGRPLRHGAGLASASPPAPVLDVCHRLAQSVPLPPALVVDVGLIEDRGWAVVEFNPVWCSGLLSADAAKVLDLLERACLERKAVGEMDRRWVVDRRTGR